MMNCTREREKNGVILRLSGDLVIQHAAELRSALMEAFNDGETLDIDVSAVQQADISCLQLLCASHKRAIESNKGFRMLEGWSDMFRQSVQDACFLRHNGCVIDAKRECLWAKE